MGSPIKKLLFYISLDSNAFHWTSCFCPLLFLCFFLKKDMLNTIRLTTYGALTTQPSAVFCELKQQCINIHIYIYIYIYIMCVYIYIYVYIDSYLEL